MKGVVSLFVVFDVVFITLSCLYFLHFICCSFTFTDHKLYEFENNKLINKLNSLFATKCDYVFWQFSLTA